MCLGDGIARLTADHLRDLFELIEQSPRVTICGCNQALPCRIVDAQMQFALTGARDEQIQFVVSQRLQHVHGRAREQRVVHFKRWVLGGRADECEQTRLDVR